MIRVLVVDDLNIIRQGIKAFLAQEANIEIIGFAHNGKEAIDSIRKIEAKPDIVLMDLLMPIIGGIKATEEICREFPEIKIVIISDLKNAETASYAVKIGARGYLFKSRLNASNLINAIYSAQNGYIQLDAEIVGHSITSKKKEVRHPTYCISNINQSSSQSNNNTLNKDNDEGVIKDFWLETAK